MSLIHIFSLKGSGKRGHNVADTNVSPFARARRLLVVGLFSKVGGALLYRELGEPPGGMDGKGLGRDEKKPTTDLTTDSFVIFEDMPVSPATEKLIGQFKLCARNGVKDLAINCFFICTRAALARYKLCFKTLRKFRPMTRLITRR